MKKIFAIALALVMVLSMASAFASPCTAGFDWTCATTDTNCGKATVEVVPYVKTNAACNGSAFVQSDCAAAINGENVYYAIKVTVDEDVDLEWWAKVKFELDVNGMKKNYDDVAVKAPKLNKDETEDGWVYYYVVADNAWFEATEDEDFEIDDVMNKSVVKEFAKAKVCMTLKSASKGLAGTVGEYWVEYVKGVDAVEAKAATKATLTFTVDEGTLNKSWYPVDWSEVSVLTAGGKTTVTLEYKTAGKLSSKALKAVKDNVHGVVPTIVDGTAAVEAVEGVVNALVVFNKQGGDPLVTYIIKDGKVGTIDYTKVCGEAEYATIKAFFGLEIGTCVDADLIAANFGWDDEVKSCYAWKTENATAIVDAECVVAIPKTGDASVLAWLF